jgi:hypothetical protein
VRQAVVDLHRPNLQNIGVMESKIGEDNAATPNVTFGDEGDTNRP